jgi:hypothetical protein
VLYQLIERTKLRRQQRRERRLAAARRHAV